MGLPSELHRALLASEKAAQRELDEVTARRIALIGAALLVTTGSRPPIARIVRAQSRLYEADAHYAIVAGRQKARRGATFILSAFAAGTAIRLRYDDGRQEDVAAARPVARSLADAFTVLAVAGAASWVKTRKVYRPDPHAVRSLLGRTAVTENARAFSDQTFGLFADNLNAVGWRWHAEAGACSLCSALAGPIDPISGIRPPRHPHCRCIASPFWLPVRRSRLAA